jgi:3-oxoacyl-[acyl-carrier-protein] synthase-1
VNRVAITGMGITSSIGNNCSSILNSLQNNISGISLSPKLQELGIRSQIVGDVDIDFNEYFTRKELRLLSPVAALSNIAMKEAIEMSNLTESEISSDMTGLIVGSGSASNKNVIDAYNTFVEKGIRFVDPFRILKTMGSTTSASLTSNFKIKGISYSISAACSTSSHSIGNAFNLIQDGRQNIMFAGGAEEVHWTSAVLFDAMRALMPTDNPEYASIPFGRDRNGFVISGGSGIVVLENLEYAKKRGANIFAELVGYGFNSDGGDMVKPNPDGASLAMQRALSQAKKLGVNTIDYINTHATSTKLGDISEIEAIKQVFKTDIPLISSTKSITGHSIGASGVHEFIYSILMMQNNFIFGNHNYELDDDFKNIPILQQNRQKQLNAILSNSFGFGGTNSSLIIKKYE